MNLSDGYSRAIGQVMTSRELRFRRWAWVSATFVTLSCAVWLVSCRWSAGYIESTWAVSIGEGGLHVVQNRLVPHINLSEEALLAGASETGSQLWSAWREDVTLHWVPRYYQFAMGDGTYLRDLLLPLWIPCLLVIGMSGLWYWRIRRFKEGSCRHCQYDLTGNTSGVCPECGTPIVAA